MKRWDLLTGASGVLATFAFALLVYVMVQPQMADLSIPAYAVLAIGALGIVVGIAGMSREVRAQTALAESESGFSMNGRLDVYRQLQRERSRRGQ